MRKTKRLIRNTETGMTLIEVLIAIVLLGIVGLAIISGLGTAFRANAVADGQTTAMTIAQRQLEDLQHQSYKNDGIYTAIVPDSPYTIMSYNEDDSTLIPGVVGYAWNTIDGEYDASINGIQRIKLVIAVPIIDVGEDPEDPSDDTTTYKILHTLTVYKVQIP
ncbi:MAG: type II secretion system protein [Dehalococcoidales bacterium]|nr:type II secretion system protein [Dehalococcoidales bacterium]